MEKSETGEGSPIPQPAEEERKLARPVADLIKRIEKSEVSRQKEKHAMVSTGRRRDRAAAGIGTLKDPERNSETVLEKQVVSNAVKISAPSSMGDSDTAESSGQHVSKKTTMPQPTKDKRKSGREPADWPGRRHDLEINIQTVWEELGVTSGTGDQATGSNVVSDAAVHQSTAEKRSSSRQNGAVEQDAILKQPAPQPEWRKEPKSTTEKRNLAVVNGTIEKDIGLKH